jgi:hypothetical protein
MIYSTNDDTLSEVSETDEPTELLPEPKESWCGEIFRTTPPQSCHIDTESSCLFLFFQPKLSFQLGQCSTWTQGSTFPVFNIWRPASYFGATITHMGSTSVKLNSHDLIVTNFNEDTEALKSQDSDAITFTENNVVAAINIDRPRFFQCSVCFSFRGRVILANGERWNFNEIGYDYYHFTHQYYQDMPENKRSPYSFVWMFYHSSRTAMINSVPDDLPFTLDHDTRMCQVKRGTYRGNDDYDDSPNGPVLAFMNRDGIVCCNGLEKSRDIATDDIRELVLMTGLAVAQYEKWLK